MTGARSIAPRAHITAIDDAYVVHLVSPYQSTMGWFTYCSREFSWHAARSDAMGPMYRPLGMIRGTEDTAVTCFECIWRQLRDARYRLPLDSSVTGVRNIVDYTWKTPT